MKREYTCLISSLPELIIDFDAKKFDFFSLRKEIEDSLHPNDYELVKILFLHYDNQNLLNTLLQKDFQFCKKANFTENELDEKIKKSKVDNEKCLSFTKKLDFVKEVISGSMDLEKDIIENIRSKVQETTTEQFSKLMWKHTFDNVVVDKNYKIFIEKGNKRISPNDLSAGERLTLALSFVVSLNNISGFDLPIMIDTPMGRLDKEIKENIAETLPIFSKNKQVILIVTGEEYSMDFRENIIENVGKEYKIKLNSNETESKVILCPETD